MQGLLEKKQAALFVWFAIGLLGAALGWILACQTVLLAGGHDMGLWPPDWRYADSNIPMISSADGFMYIHAARQALEGGYEFSVISNFSALTAFVSSITSLPVEAAAFYMSFFCHLGLGIIAALWGRFLRAGLFPSFCAALLTALMPAWLERGGPGRFDTDLAILLFWQAGLYFLAKSLYRDGPGPARPSVGHALAALIFFALLAAVWTSGWLLAAATLAAWAFLFLPRRVFPIKLRLAAFSIALLWAGSIIFFPDATPAPRIAVDMVHTRLSLYFGIRPELFYSSIKELKPQNIWEILEKLGGGAPGGIAVILAAAFAAIWRPCLRFPLFLAAIFVIAGFKANRLSYFASFQMALAAAFLPAFSADLLRGRFSRLSPRMAWAAGFAVFLGILANSAHWAAKRDLDIRWERGHDSLLESLRRENGAREAYFWNWWDDGYFLQARTSKIHPLFHGGAPSHIMAHIAARPFVMDDRRAAARWMRFFALRGPWAMNPLIKAWGEEEAWLRLEKILASENPPDMAESLADIPGGAAYFFPKGRVYWYMPAYFTKISLWWLPLGLSRTPDEKLVRPHLETIGRDKFFYDPKKKALTISQDLWDRGYKKFGLVLNTDVHPLAPPWPAGGAPYIVYSDGSDKGYITDEPGLKSLPLYMLAPGGPPLPNFRQAAFDSGYGGIWEILP